MEKISLVVWFIAGLLGAFDFLMLFGKKKNRESILFWNATERLWLYLILVAICVPFTGWTLIKGWYDSVPDGVYCYEVIVSNGKSEYRLPAEVTKMTLDDVVFEGYDYYTGDVIENVKYYDAYNISRVYWPNGGYLVFSENEWQDMGSTMRKTDQDYRSWEVTRTDIEREHEKIKTYSE